MTEHTDPIPMPIDFFVKLEGQRIRVALREYPVPYDRCDSETEEAKATVEAIYEDVQNMLMLLRFDYVNDPNCEEAVKLRKAIRILRASLITHLQDLQ